MLEHHDALDESGDAGSALQMADVGLDGPDDNGPIDGPASAEGFGNGPELPPVACLGARAMAFHVPGLIEAESSSRIYRLDVGDLGLLAWQRDA